MQQVPLETLSRADEIDRRAEEFMSECPRAWELFQRFTWEALTKGRRRFGAKAVFARRFLRENPEIGTVFEVRERISKQR